MWGTTILKVSSVQLIRCGNDMPSEKAKREYRERNREKLRERSKAYYYANKEKCYAANVAWKKANAEYCREQHRIQEKIRTERKRVEAAGGRTRPEVCDVCKRVGVIRWDHCHQSGKFRGWLCARCNNTLGHCQDNPEILKALILYLEKNQ